MISLTLKEQENRTVTLPGGATVTLRPVMTPSFEAAGAIARRKVAALLQDAEALKALGLTPDIIDDAKDGLFLGVMTEELAVLHITAWTGFADETGEREAPLTDEYVRRLMKNRVLAKMIYTAIIDMSLPEISLKKGSGTVADGTSAAAPDTAEGART